MGVVAVSVFAVKNTFRKGGQMEETVEMVAAFSLWVIVR